jgi:hypothetical protein
MAGPAVDAGNGRGAGGYAYEGPGWHPLPSFLESWNPGNLEPWNHGVLDSHGEQDAPADGARGRQTGSPGLDGWD